jgi:hypothetical protein
MPVSEKVYTDKRLFAFFEETRKRHLPGLIIVSTASSTLVCRSVGIQTRCLMCYSPFRLSTGLVNAALMAW